MVDFNKRAYSELLSRFRDAGYMVKQFGEQKADNETPSLVIRHDIDIDIRCAFELAKLEADMGVKSTFFLSLRSPFFNPFSAQNEKLLKNIIDLDHKIGTHIKQPINDNGHSLFIDIEILSNYFPFIDVNLATFHHPGPLDNLKNYIHLDCIRNTAGELFEGRACYISDSTGRWRFGHPLETDAFLQRKTILLSTHPVWWVVAGNTPLEKLSNLLGDRMEVMKDDIKDYLPSFYNDFIK